MLAFKEDFIDTGAVNGRFAQALKSVTLKLGNMVQAGCSKEINGIFDQQEADMEAASEEDRQMANEYKKEARKDNGIVPPVTGLLDATDFSPFELLGGSTTTNVHPSVKMEKNGVYFGLVSATYNDHRVVKIGHTSNSEMRIKQHGKAFEGFMVVAFVPTLNYKQLEKKILDAYAHFKVPKEGREKCHRELFFLIDGIKSLQAMYTYAMDQNRSFLTVQSSPSKKYKLQHELKIKKIEEATKIELYRVEKEKDNELLLALMEGMSVDDKIKLLRSTKQ